jgi:hypothetical protein
MDEIRSIPAPRADAAATRRSESGAVLVTTFGRDGAGLDAKALKRLDDHREPRSKTRRDYDELFESVG